MKRIILLLGLVLCVTASAFAQSETNPAVEVFAGASILRNGATAPSYSLYGGWQTQASFNINRYFGLTADFGGQYRSILGVRAQQYEYLVGPRVMLRERRATLFAHALVGGNTFHAPGGSLHGFATAIGGGLDYNVGNHFAVRAVQVDYLRARLSNTWVNDARVGVGIVFKF